MPERKEKMEGEVYYPSKEVLETSRVKDYDCLYKLSVEDREGFWEKEAEKLTWYKKWDKVLDDSQKPFYKWYTGGKINIVANAIDRHLVSDTRNKLALIWEGEPGDIRTFSFFALNREVSKFGNVLKALGAKKGDVVTIYMPQIPELIISMLACAKIGAAHSVVYGGFSVEALAERIADARSHILITADGGFRRGKPFPVWS
jgi:acetyl-CoA synthetase